MIPVYNLVRPDESYMVVSLPSIQLTPNNDLRRRAGGQRLQSVTDPSTYHQIWLYFERLLGVGVYTSGAAACQRLGARDV